MMMLTVTCAPSRTVMSNIHVIPSLACVEETWRAMRLQRFSEPRISRGCGVAAVACGIVLAALEVSEKTEVRRCGWVPGDSSSVPCSLAKTQLAMRCVQERSKLQNTFEKLRVRLLEATICNAARAEIKSTQTLVAAILAQR